MRLTLRTLLALRDGLLQGAERDDLSAKVAASTVAPRLLEQIAELSGRADLPSPHADANAVAEFLDNVLAGDQLEAFERACLESEPHLAEAADCHTLLAELIRDATVSPSLDPTNVERLLELIGREKPSQGIAALQDDPLDIGDIMRAAKAAAERPASTPAKQRPGASVGAWVSAGVAIVLLLVLGGLLLRSIWPVAGRSRDVAVNEPATDSPELREPVPVAPAKEASPNEQDEPPAPEPVPEPVDEAPVASVEVREPGPPKVSGDPREAEPFPPSNETASPFPLPADESIIPLPVMEADEPEQAAGATKPDAPDASQPQAAAVDGPQAVSGGPLLHRVLTENDSGWRAVSAGSKLASTEEFIVPFHSYPHIVRGDVSLRLLPGTRGALTVDRDGTWRIEIVFGRAVVWSEAANASVGITAGGLSGVFSLAPRQPVGIDIELTRDRGMDPAVVPPGMHALMIAIGGGRFRQTERDGGVPGVPLAGLEIEQPLPPRGGIMWDAAAPGAARVMPMSQDHPWMKLIGPVHVVDRHAAEAMTTALAADVPADAALRMMAESRRVEDRMAAAATLALLGDFDLLVETLCQESSNRKLREGEWAELEAMTVPLALARGANAATALRQAFARKGPPGRADELFLLARGLTSDELSAGGAEGLVKALEDPSLVVRRYALKNLAGLLPDSSTATRDYRPDRSALLNDKGLAWWRARLAEGLGSGEADATKTP